MPKEPEKIVAATIYFRNTGVPFLDAECWRDEDGSVLFRSVEFPFLIASADTEQEAVNNLADSAEQFFREVNDLDEDATRDELLAAKEIGSRLVDGYSELERRREKRRAISRLIGRTRRELRGDWRLRFHKIGERSPQISRV